MDERLQSLDQLEVPDQWDDITNRTSGPPMDPPHRGPSRLVAGAVAMAVAVGGLGFWLVRLNDSGQTTPAVSPSPPYDVTAAITQTVDTGIRFPEGVVVDDAGVWVAANRGMANGGDLLRLDPVTGDIAARIPVPSLPGWEFGGAGIATGLGSVWISAYGTDDHTPVVVYRIDPQTDALADTIDVGPGGAADLWVDDTGIWVLAFAHNGPTEWLYHLDAATHEVLSKTDIPANWSDTVAGAGGWIWVLGNTDNSDGAPAGTLFRIDPATGKIVERSDPAGGDSFRLTVSGDNLWFFHHSELHGLDANTGTEGFAPLDLPEHCCSGLVADGTGGVWVISGTGEGPGIKGVWHVSADGVIDQHALGNPGPKADGIAAAFDATTTSVWIVHYQDTVSRLQITPTP